MSSMYEFPVIELADLGLIRKASSTELKFLAQLEADNFTEPWTLEQLEETSTNEHDILLVFIKDKEILAYISWQLVLDEASLLRVVVSPLWRNRGIATNLLQATMEVLADWAVKKFFLEVSEKNITAIKLYEKLGFSQLAIRKSYYGADEAAVIMQVIRQ